MCCFKADAKYNLFTSRGKYYRLPSLFTAQWCLFKGNLTLKASAFSSMDIVKGECPPLTPALGNNFLNHRVQKAKYWFFVFVSPVYWALENTYSRIINLWKVVKTDCNVIP